MLYLFLSILCSIAIILIFRISDRYDIRTFPLVAINYFFASLSGILLLHFRGIPLVPDETGWIPLALVTGLLFVGMFYLVGLSSARCGVSLTGMFSRLSVVIPICFSILYYGEQTGLLKISGILLALPALYLSSWKDKSTGAVPKHSHLLIFLFLGTGFTDSLVKYTQGAYLEGQSSFLFPTLVFTVSLVSATVLVLFRPTVRREILKTSTLSAGALLGICNFFSLFFFIQALNHSGFDSSVVFGLNHLCIILLSLLSGLILFRENLNRTNILGFMLACIAVVLLYCA